MELADLWDVSILVTDRISGLNEFERCMPRLCRSPPAKFLQLGTDCLITERFRGGGGGLKSKRGLKRKHVPADEAFEPKRGAIGTGTKPGRADEGSKSKERVVRLLGWPRQAVPTPLDLVEAPTWNKQDGQKADDASVPTHMWLFFFKHRYKQTFGLDLDHPSWRGWEGALDVFRRKGLSFWRRGVILRSYRRWRLKHYSLEGEWSKKGQEMKHHAYRYVEMVRLLGRVSYRWRIKKGKQAGLKRWMSDHAELAERQDYLKSRSMARDAMAKAAGHFAADHPKYLSAWWEWTCGSTLFFWRWPERY